MRTHVAHKARFALAAISLLLFAAGTVRSPAQAQDDARPEIVVIVSADNPLASLDRTQVEDLFLGRTLQFPDGRPANPVDQTEGSAVRNQFTTDILQRSPAQVRSHWSRIVFTGKGRPPRTLGSSDAVADLVGRDPQAIGYVERRYLSDKVKVVLDGESATP